MLRAALYPGLFRNAIYHSGSYSPGMESRATGAYTFTLPAERGKEIHLFAFFKNKYRNIFSESRFLGTVVKET